MMNITFQSAEAFGASSDVDAENSLVMRIIEADGSFAAVSDDGQVMSMEEFQVFAEANPGTIADYEGLQLPAENLITLLGVPGSDSPVPVEISYKLMESGEGLMAVSPVGEILDPNEFIRFSRTNPNAPIELSDGSVVTAREAVDLMLDGTLPDANTVQEQPTAVGDGAAAQPAAEEPAAAGEPAASEDTLPESISELPGTAEVDEALPAPLEPADDASLFIIAPDGTVIEVVDESIAKAQAAEPGHTLVRGNAISVQWLADQLEVELRDEIAELEACRADAAHDPLLGGLSGLAAEDVEAALGQVPDAVEPAAGPSMNGGISKAATPGEAPVELEISDDGGFGFNTQANMGSLTGGDPVRITGALGDSSVGVVQAASVSALSGSGVTGGTSGASGTPGGAGPDLVLEPINGDAGCTVPVEGLATLANNPDIFMVVIENVPEDLTFSAGTIDSNGDLIIPSDALSNLTVTLGDTPSEFTLSINAIGTTGETRATIPTTVTPPELDPEVTATDVTGLEDAAIALNIDVTPPENCVEETLQILISDVPPGAVLSAGEETAPGVYALSPDQIEGLFITPPVNSDADFTLTVTAIAETPSGLFGTTQQQLDVTVDAVADAPEFSFASPVLTNSLPEGAIPVNLQGNLTDRDGSETLTLHFSGVPEGASILGATDLGNGAFELPNADGTGVFLIPGTAQSQDFALTVSATSTEAAGDYSTSTTTLQVSIPDNGTTDGTSPTDNAPVLDVAPITIAEPDSPSTDPVVTTGQISDDFFDNSSNVSFDPDHFPTHLTSDGRPITFEVADINNGEHLVARAGDETILEIWMRNDGRLIVRQHGSIDHKDGDTVDLGIGVSGTTTTGHTISTELTVTVVDSGITGTPEGQAIIDEIGVTSGPVTVSGALATGEGFGVEVKLDPFGLPEGINHEGQILTWEINDDGSAAWGLDPSGAEVLLIHLAQDGQYSITQSGSVDHAPGQDQLDISFGVIATDDDGDRAYGHLDVSITDGVPTAIAQSQSIATLDTSYTTNLTFDEGSDLPATFSWSTPSDQLTVNGEAVQFDTSSDGWSLVGRLADGQEVVSIRLDEGKQAHVTQSLPIDQEGSISVPYTVQDYDGDHANASLTLSFVSAPPLVTTTPVNEPVDDWTTPTEELETPAEVPYDSYDESLGVGDVSSVVTRTVTETSVSVHAEVTGTATARIYFDESVVPDGLGFEGYPLEYTTNEAGDVLTAHSNGTTVFELRLSGDDSYEFVQFQPVEPLDGHASLDLIFGLTVSGNSNTQLFAIDPSQVQFSVETRSVTEDSLADGGSAIVAGAIDSLESVNADDVSLAIENLPRGLTAGGEPVGYQLSADQQSISAVAADEQVFSLSLQPDGQYEFVLHKPLDHGSGGSDGDAIILDFGIGAYDDRGTQSAHRIAIEIVDDRPSIGVSADTTSLVLNTGADAGDDVLFTISHGEQEFEVNDITQIRGDHGLLEIDPSGTYRYMADDPDQAFFDTFIARYSDNDGDTAAVAIEVSPWTSDGSVSSDHRSPDELDNSELSDLFSNDSGTVLSAAFTSFSDNQTTLTGVSASETIDTGSVIADPERETIDSILHESLNDTASYSTPDDSTPVTTSTDTQLAGDRAIGSGSGPSLLDEFEQHISSQAQINQTL